MSKDYEWKVQTSETLLPPEVREKGKTNNEESIEKDEKHQSNEYSDEQSSPLVSPGPRRFSRKKQIPLLQF